MNDHPNHPSFQYTYSASEQEELKKIRSRYMPREENKLDLVRRLDAQATQKAAMYAIIAGVIGTLIFGTGMSCCLMLEGAAFVLGVIVGVTGLAIAAIAYPLHNRTLQRERARIAPEILRLTEELIK